MAKRRRRAKKNIGQARASTERVSFKCPACDAKVTLKNAEEANRGRCPECGERFKEAFKQAKKDSRVKGDEKTIQKDLLIVDRQFGKARGAVIGMWILIVMLMGLTFFFQRKIGWTATGILWGVELIGILVGWHFFWKMQGEKGRLMVNDIRTFHETDNETLFQAASKHAKLRKKYDFLNMIDPETAAELKQEHKEKANTR